MGVIFKPLIAFQVIMYMDAFITIFLSDQCFINTDNLDEAGNWQIQFLSLVSDYSQKIW